MAAALSRVYAGLCRRDRLTSKECPFWLDSLFCACGEAIKNGRKIIASQTQRACHAAAEAFKEYEIRRN